MSQIISIPGTAITHDPQQNQQLEITFGSDTEDSPEHRITTVKYKSAMATKQTSTVQLIEGGVNANNQVSDSIKDGQIKHQLAMSPSTEILQTGKLINLNPTKMKPPYLSGTKKHRQPDDHTALGVPMEESFEDDENNSLPGDYSDLGKAKQKLIQMEERYNKITFKKMPKKAAQQAREGALKERKKKEILDKYNTKANFTQQQWNSTKQINLPNPLIKDQSEETEFNFKAPNKNSPKDRISNFNNTKINWTTEQTTDGGDGLKTINKLNSLTNSSMLKTNQKFNNSRQDKFYNTQTSPMNFAEKWTSPVSTAQVCPKGASMQFSSLEQAKRFRQRSLLEAAYKEKDQDDKLNQNLGNDLSKNQSANQIGTSPFNFGANAIAAPNSVFKNSRAHLAGTRLNTTSKLSDISILPGPNPNLEKLPLSWAEEQRIKKLVSDYEEIELASSQDRDQDPLLKLKSQLDFILNKAMKVVSSYCNQDLCQLMERGLGNLLQLNQQKITKYRNDLKFYEIEKQKHLKMIDERDKAIFQYRIRDLSEEEKAKLSWKERQVRMDKYKKIDEVIDQLFEEEAICVQKVEPHFIVNQPLEEQELAEEERTLNFRRMNWLEKDMELMMRLIQMDVNESYRIYDEAKFEKHLSVLAETLKEGVDLGIQNQIANFHLRIEEILKENQRILKSKLPEKIDRCYQTDTWNMERYLEELDSLKRQKWITDKQIKDNNEQAEKHKERIKKLKDDNIRLGKKIANMQEKERTIDSQLHEKDKLMQDIKEEALKRITEAQKKEVEKAKDLKALQEKYDTLNQMKLDREVEMLKREEEQQKKMEQMDSKMKTAQAAVKYFNKILKKKEADMENTKEIFEMQMKIQSMITSGDNSDMEEKANIKSGNKKNNKKNLASKKSLNMKEINESKEHSDGSKAPSVINSSRIIPKEHPPQMIKKEVSGGLSVQAKKEPAGGLSLQIPVKNSVDYLNTLQSPKPLLSNRNRRSSVFLDENHLAIERQNIQSREKSPTSARINKDSFDGPSINNTISKNNDSISVIKVEGIMRKISPNIMIDNFESSKDELNIKYQGSPNDGIVHQASQDDVVNHSNIQDEMSITLSAEGNKTVEISGAKDHNLIIKDDQLIQKKQTQKHVSLKIDDQESSNYEVATRKSIPAKTASMLITTEEKSIQVDNPVIIYQPSSSFAQSDKAHKKLKSTNSSQPAASQPPPSKPLMFVEATQTTEQIPFDYINMIIRYEEEQRKNSVPHVAKALQKNKLPTAADLAALNAPLVAASQKKTVNMTANVSQYQTSQFINQLENQLGTQKKNSLESQKKANSPPENFNAGVQYKNDGIKVDENTRNSIHKSQYGQSNSLPSQPLNQTFQQNSIGSAGVTSGSDLVPFQGTNGQIVMLPASAFSPPVHQRSPTNDIFSAGSQSSGIPNNRLKPVFSAMGGVPQNFPAQMMNNTATFNGYRGLPQIPSAITEEDLNNRAQEETKEVENKVDEQKPRKNFVLNYSPQRSIVNPSGDSPSPAVRNNSHQEWNNIVAVKKKEAIEQAKQQIKTKITKNIAVALNTLVGKNNKNPAAAMERMLNMKNTAALVENASLNNSLEIEALKETVEQNIAVVKQPQPYQQQKKLSPSPPSVSARPQPISQSVQAPQVPPQIQQMRQIVFENGPSMSNSVGIGNTKQSQLFRPLIPNELQPQFVVVPNQVNGNIFTNEQLPAIKERSGQQSSKFSLRGETSHKDARESLQNVDLLEYYQKMRPEKGFQALLIGRPMSIEEVRLTSGQLVERSRSNSPNEKFKIQLPDARPDSQEIYFLNADIPQIDQSDPSQMKHFQNL